MLGLGLLYGANVAEVFRAGLEAVPLGQREAALTLGLSRRQAMQSVVLPQATRIVIPPLGNYWIGILKTRRSCRSWASRRSCAREHRARELQAVRFYTTVAIIYVILVLSSAGSSRRRATAAAP